MLKKIIFALLLLVALFAGIGMLLPSQFEVSRSLVMQAPPERIYAQIAAPKAWKEWSVWNRRDPAMLIEYSGPESGLGAMWKWQSKTEGNGQMTCIAADPGKHLVYQLEFPDMGMQSRGEFTLQVQDGGTLVTWRDSGDMGNNPLNRWFGLVMDKMLGPDFEGGLHNLKDKVEAGA